MNNITLIYPYPDYKNWYYNRIYEDGSYALNPDQLSLIPESVYYDILSNIRKNKIRCSYVGVVSKEFANKNEIKLPYYTVDPETGIELVYTDSIEAISLYLNQFNNMWVRGNYIFWNSLSFLMPDKKYLILPCNSQITAENLKYNPKNKIVLVDDNEMKKTFLNAGIPCDVFQKPARKMFYTNKSKKKDVDILFVCSSTDRSHKRFDLMLDSLELLNKQTSDPIRFGVAGDITFHKNRIEQLKQSLKKIEIVIFGSGKRVPHDILRNLYLRSKMTVCTSSIDSNPRIIAESLACGTPVLCASDILGGKFQITKNTGKLFEPTAQGLSLSIQQMLQIWDGFDTKKYCIKISDSVNQIIKYCV